MGIEDIKKAKEEEKKTFKRPSQKVAALLIALGPATASEILKNIKDEVKVLVFITAMVLHRDVEYELTVTAILVIEVF